jgi:hypothetical protein
MVRVLGLPTPEEAQLDQARKAFHDAIKRGDTRDQHVAAMALQRARTNQLAREMGFRL